MRVLLKTIMMWVFPFVILPIQVYSGDESPLFEDIETQKLSNILKTAGWIDYHEGISLTPTVATNETVAYVGNVPPTSLYKLDHRYILPVAPYVHPYHPDFDCDYVFAAVELKSTEALKTFFSGVEINKAFIVAQQLINPSESQLLRLHGFIHGVNAASANASTPVTAEIKPIHGVREILFSDNATSKTDSVHTHEGVASPCNFALKGFKPEVFDFLPCWQATALYLPQTKTATLLIFGQSFNDEGLSLHYGEPVLTKEASVFLRKTIGTE